ncbi:MAG: 2,3-diphosphoglycerate-dependent phosphoglycerate mutase [SAR202 cluster bacterium]|nr:2,3-diphosphoglycerate-dependent phosphoglycerate mutase [SAR202 cluster bacterium]|tara:strand:+ start:76963 stop:77703 length:741 start_codon:yes stop_codon:yes gene_type:complete
MYEIVLIRHGESEWNLANRFTGWADVDLTDKGVLEAKKAAQELMKQGFMFDMAYTSVLKRAIRTLWTVLDDMDLMWIPVTRSWRLNERHYGDLQGLNKAETASVHGEEQVLIWRRSYSIPPPPLNDKDQRHPSNDSRYSELKKLPNVESLKDTVERVVPYWEKEIIPSVVSGKKILVVAHGNSIRALIKYLEDISEDEIVNLNIPTGVPVLYRFTDKLEVLERKFLGDEEEIKKAMENVASQGKTK